MLYIGGPLSITLLCRFIHGFVDLVIIGHYLGTQALAGASLALTVQFTTMGFVTQGFGDAVPTLCSQALGAKNKPLLGIWLQLGWISCTAACIPILIFWWYTGELLQLCGVSSEVAAFASRFNRLSMPRMWIHCMYYCLKMFLSSQRVTMPDLVVNLIGIGTNAGLNVLLVGGAGRAWAGLGFDGSPAATVLSRLLILSMLGGYTVIRKPHDRETWGGFDLLGALRKDRVKVFLGIALPSALRAALDLLQVRLLEAMVRSYFVSMCVPILAGAVCCHYGWQHRGGGRRHAQFSHRAVRGGGWCCVFRQRRRHGGAGGPRPGRG